ncbi:hypothetical protein [Kitasatospora sp. NPDC088346]|uniref:hypothetical protein n=1 Tax=Kitasatospora sp. NPDC088346 TaxID=3364073 RepID=UPI00380894C7
MLDLTKDTSSELPGDPQQTDPTAPAAATPAAATPAGGTKKKSAGKSPVKKAGKAGRNRRRARRRVAETAAYTGLGLIALAEPWALLLIVPALLLALRD